MVDRRTIMGVEILRSQQHDEVKMHQAETQKLRGPDGYGVAKGWRLPGKVGVSSDVSVT